MVFIILGVLALYGDTRWLLALIPVAVLVWYVASATTFKEDGTDKGKTPRVGR